MNQVHISISVIFIITITSLTGKKLNKCNNPNDTCLLDYVIPIHYHIKLTHVYMETYESYWTKPLNLKKENDSFTFNGESHTTINILRSTQYIKVHALNLTLYEDITLIRNHGIIYVLKYDIDESETNIFRLYFFNVLSPGLYTLKLIFSGQLTESSSKNFFKSFYTNKKNSIVWVNIKQ